MSSHVRVLALLVPVFALLTAEEGPATVQATVPAPAAAPAAAQAADNSLRNNLDLRLTVGGGGEITRVTNEDTDVKTDYEDGNGATIALHLLYVRANPGGIGFAVGGGPSAHTYTGEPEGGGAESTVHAVGIDLYAAFVWRPTRNWHFELPAVVVTGGSAVVETDGGDDSETGGYGRFAAQLGAYYTFDFGLQLGLDVGAAGFGTTVEYDNTDEEYSFSGGGGYLNFNVGYRF
jgi:hypothetical protein